MNKRNLGLILLSVLVLTGLVNADVPPPSGYERVSINLIVETTEDLSDYRFYLDFFGDKKDVEIKSKGVTNLPSMGGGARYSSGTLWAVSKTNPNPPIELLKHQFSREVPNSESGKLATVIYQIERSGDTLKVIANQQVTPNSRGGELDFTVYGIVKEFTPIFYILVGGVLLFTIALIIFGVRKFRQKSNNIK